MNQEEHQEETQEQTEEARQAGTPTDEEVIVSPTAQDELSARLVDAVHAAAGLPTRQGRHEIYYRLGREITANLLKAADPVKEFMTEAEKQSDRTINQGIHELLKVRRQTAYKDAAVRFGQRALRQEITDQDCEEYLTDPGQVGRINAPTGQRLRRYLKPGSDPTPEQLLEMEQLLILTLHASEISLRDCNEEEAYQAARRALGRYADHAMFRRYPAANLPKRQTEIERETLLDLIFDRVEQAPGPSRIDSSLAVPADSQARTIIQTAQDVSRYKIREWGEQNRPDWLTVDMAPIHEPGDAASESWRRSPGGFEGNWVHPEPINPREASLAKQEACITECWERARTGLGREPDPAWFALKLLTPYLDQDFLVAYGRYCPADWADYHGDGPFNFDEGWYCEGWYFDPLALPKVYREVKDELEQRRRQNGDSKPTNLLHTPGSRVHQQATYCRAVRNALMHQGLAEDAANHNWEALALGLLRASSSLHRLATALRSAWPKAVMSWVDHTGDPDWPRNYRPSTVEDEENEHTDETSRGTNPVSHWGGILSTFKYLHELCDQDKPTPADPADYDPTTDPELNPRTPARKYPLKTEDLDEEFKPRDTALRRHLEEVRRHFVQDHEYLDLLNPEDPRRKVWLSHAKAKAIEEEPDVDRSLVNHDWDLPRRVLLREAVQELTAATELLEELDAYQEEVAYGKYRRQREHLAQRQLARHALERQEDNVVAPLQSYLDYWVQEPGDPELEARFHDDPAVALARGTQPQERMEIAELGLSYPVIPVVDVGEAVLLHRIMQRMRHADWLTETVRKLAAAEPAEE